MSILIDKKLYITTFFLWIIRLTFWQSPHGDYEEHGETINLGENFKVEKIIFNCVEYNDLENKLNAGDKLSDEEYKEACLFLKLYVVLVCEEALSKGEDEKITIEGKPFKPRFTIDQVKSMINNFIQSKLGI